MYAHPDDETMLAGGVLALLARSGAHVHYLCATRGEGGETGEPPVCSRADLGQAREAELVCAVQALGGRSLTFLGYVDPTIGPGEELFAFTDNLTLLAGQIAASLSQFNADVLISHGSDGEYGHPAHVLTHQAARIAIEDMASRTGEGPAPVFYTSAASFPGHPRPRLTNPHDPAHLVIDAGPVLSQKTQAALCHRTQHALFVRRASQEAGRQLTVPEVVLSLEGLHRFQPPAQDSPDDILSRTLQPYLYQKQDG
jgi:LmbE family N-acetylglucosaminyl deacetylase